MDDEAEHSLIDCELCAPAILSELARVKALFQLRAVVACIGGGL